MSIKLKIRQLAKMLLQNCLLPFIYFLNSRGKIEKGLVLFADAHHNDCPFSMRVMRKKVAQMGDMHIKEFYLDFSKCGKLQMARFILDFMTAFGRAEYVFICDTFLPVSSCKKRRETFVTQLWHSCGLLKKAGYDSKDCVPSFYKGEVFGGYDLWTVSAECVAPIMAESMHQKLENVKALGVSRTDIYYSKKYNDLCREKFFKAHPDAAGRTIVLWAPTFRGNAAEPFVVGEDIIEQVCKARGWYLIKKLHPHMQSDDGFPTERLFAVADILVTDYSSVVFDWLLYKKPFVFFAPDLREFDTQRGFYVDYFSFPTTVAQTADELAEAVEQELLCRSTADLEACAEYHMSACDGHATDRIINVIFGRKER
ncbi:MAG: CDP-glycerol glycerophosphotransferase family protein [Ruminococcus sp.]|uniref:CDP-glycerol glycerophosphotransferase family protein n=1 Tax=Ruminococcus sp. TaxID=41978 RepID=UPI0025FEF5A2|nr:CDP-glycerol glycerophosphotransferase family protein [Ruminococcus sp.]MBR0529758.1 CDP-glycerol glycerophosphotransferase family protein [Ruminococcus sp.]